ncbi:hypothetical protein HXX76_015397 [Chlamydomonas incerta]|uniref:Aminoglycoside phosphotransferase domain-containing protein n=1 Tax=Chlamydomonas incerta TaxID=51695 RepID=A0A835SJ57_CHLIN|nr:hypothetical protein HXX76_015397 [Chlamydomonas incerta]|eukprot:KAG2423349.1 hypothetical protein HXX76_015397 [Chlamydomonas incerta]
MRLHATKQQGAVDGGGGGESSGAPQAATMPRSRRGATSGVVAASAARDHGSSGPLVAAPTAAQPPLGAEAEAEAPPPQQPQQQPQQVQLQFLSELAQGRDGAVFRGTCDGRPAVIKVYSFEGDQVEACAREAAAYRALAALQGSVVPKVVAAGRLAGDLRALSFLVMEPVAGGRPLSDYCRRPLPPAVKAAAEQALVRVHAEGSQYSRRQQQQYGSGGSQQQQQHGSSRGALGCCFLHGDIRLENFMLEGGGGEMEEAAEMEAEAEMDETAVRGGEGMGGSSSSGSGGGAAAGPAGAAAAAAAASPPPLSQQAAEAPAAAAAAAPAAATGAARCVLLDFGGSRLDGTAEEQAEELAELRWLLGGGSD